MAMRSAFLDGITAAGLFGKLEWPGAPAEFIDSRSTEEFDAKKAATNLLLQRSFQVLRSTTAERRMIRVLSVLFASGVLTSARLKSLLAEEGRLEKSGDHA